MSKIVPNITALIGKTPLVQFDIVVIGVGTGGSITGIGEYLKGKTPPSRSWQSNLLNHLC